MLILHLLPHIILVQNICRRGPLRRQRVLLAFRPVCLTASLARLLVRLWRRRHMPVRLGTFRRLSCARIAGHTRARAVRSSSCTTTTWLVLLHVKLVLLRVRVRILLLRGSIGVRWIRMSIRWWAARPVVLFSILLFPRMHLSLSRNNGKSIQHRRKSLHLRRPMLHLGRQVMELRDDLHARPD